MKRIVAEFILDVNQNQNAGRHSDGQTQHVDNRIYFMLNEISKGHFEIIFEHIELTPLMRIVRLYEIDVSNFNFCATEPS